MSASSDFRLPVLRFVPVDAVFPHESNDLQRTEPLVRKLRESGVMRNPPIVTQVGDGHRVEPRYVVLDGANRSTAAKAAGWPHIVAQVVRYESPTVHLHTWFHALASGARDQIEAGLARVPGVTVNHASSRAVSLSHTGSVAPLLAAVTPMEPLSITARPADLDQLFLRLYGHDAA